MDQPERTVTLNALIELVAYAGAAAAFVATLIAVERAGGLGQTGDLLVALAITAFLVGAGLAIPEASADAFRRMHSVLWFAATIAWAAAVNQFLSSVLELDPQGHSLAILTGLVATAGAVILWLRLRRSLQIAIAGVILGAGVIVGTNVPDSNTETIVALVVGLAVLVAALVAIRLSSQVSRPPTWEPPPPPAPPAAP